MSKEYFDKKAQEIKKDIIPRLLEIKEELNKLSGYCAEHIHIKSAIQNLEAYIADREEYKK